MKMMEKRLVEHNNILLSVAIASNRDQEILIKCIQNIFDRAAEPSRVEVLVRIDFEAKRSHGWIQDVVMMDGGKHRDRIRVLEGPQRFGYCSCSQFYAEMVEHSKGEFIMVYNDDIADITQDFDNQLVPYIGKIVLFRDVAPAGTHDWDFPIIHRLVYDITETMSITSYGNYHWDVFDREASELVRSLDISVSHRPTADWGSAVSLGLNCLNIQDPDYKLNKDDFYENQEGTKEEHFAKHYVSKLVEYVRQYPQYKMENRYESTN